MKAPCLSSHRMVLDMHPAKDDSDSPRVVCTTQESCSVCTRCGCCTFLAYMNTSPSTTKHLHEADACLRTLKQNRSASVQPVLAARVQPCCNMLRDMHFGVGDCSIVVPRLDVMSTSIRLFLFHTLEPWNVYGWRCVYRCGLSLHRAFFLSFRLVFVRYFFLSRSPHVVLYFFL